VAGRGACGWCARGSMCVAGQWRARVLARQARARASPPRGCRPCAASAQLAHRHHPAHKTCSPPLAMAINAAISDTVSSLARPIYDRKYTSLKRFPWWGRGGGRERATRPRPRWPRQSTQPSAGPARTPLRPIALEAARNGLPLLPSVSQGVAPAGHLRLVPDLVSHQQALHAAGALGTAHSRRRRRVRCGSPDPCGTAPLQVVHHSLAGHPRSRALQFPGRAPEGRAERPAG
jgi:hypothetical protein